MKSCFDGHNPMLMIDFYKAVHSAMYPEGLEYITSYFTPRTCRIDDNALVNFGLQGFIKDYIETFNDNFFNKELDDEYFTVLNATLGLNTYNQAKIVELHKLGYLPLKFSEIPEGTRVPIHCPMIEITNTVPGFAWVVGVIESAMSAYLWHMMVSASVGYKYRKLVNKYAKKTCGDSSISRRILGDFSFRGQESPEAATLSSAGWLLSNVNTATVPAIVYLSDNYNADIENSEVGFGAPSTEHSVMCSNYAVDGDEVTMIRRLLTEIYPTGYFTCVCDSYDYWNVVDNILPQLKDEILARNGCIGIRGDSGNPVEIVTETVFHLWNTFGGDVNNKGFKVLDKHIKVVYGDSITLTKAEDIFKILDEKGFSIENVSLGVGSFSLQCIEEWCTMKPFTRDTYGLAMKSTHCVINGEEHFIYKDPKTDNGTKKSQKGLCVVLQDFGEKLTCCDGFTISERDSYVGNCLRPLWVDGKFIHEYTLEEVRNNLWKGKFYES